MKIERKNKKTNANAKFWIGSGILVLILVGLLIGLSFTGKRVVKNEEGFVTSDTNGGAITTATNGTAIKEVTGELLYNSVTSSLLSWIPVIIAVVFGLNIIRMLTGYRSGL